MSKIIFFSCNFLWTFVQAFFCHINIQIFFTYDFINYHAYVHNAWQGWGNVYLWGSEDNLVELFLSSIFTWVLKTELRSGFGSKYFYPLSHLVGPQYF